MIFFKEINNLKNNLGKWIKIRKPVIILTIVIIICFLFSFNLRFHELEYLLDVLVSCSTVMVVPQLLLLLLWLVLNDFEVEAFPVGS